MCMAVTTLMDARVNRSVKLRDLMMWRPVNQNWRTWVIPCSPDIKPVLAGGNWGFLEYNK